MRLNPKKIKSMVVSQYLTSASSYGDLNLGGNELEAVKSLRILRETLDSKLIFETHMQEVVSNAAKNLRVVCRVGKLFDCLRVLKGCCNAYILPS